MHSFLIVHEMACLLCVPVQVSEETIHPFHLSLNKSPYSECRPTNVGLQFLFFFFAAGAATAATAAAAAAAAARPRRGKRWRLQQSARRSVAAAKKKSTFRTFSNVFVQFWTFSNVFDVLGPFWIVFGCFMDPLAGLPEPRRTFRRF